MFNLVPLIIMSTITALPPKHIDKPTMPTAVTTQYYVKMEKAPKADESANSTHGNNDYGVKDLAYRGEGNFDYDNYSHQKSELDGRYSSLGTLKEKIAKNIVELISDCEEYFALNGRYKSELMRVLYGDHNQNGGSANNGEYAPETQNPDQDRNMPQKGGNGSNGGVSENNGSVSSNNGLNGGTNNGSNNGSGSKIGSGNGNNGSGNGGSGSNGGNGGSTLPGDNTKLPTRPVPPTPVNPTNHSYKISD